MANQLAIQIETTAGNSVEMTMDDHVTILLNELEHSYDSSASTLGKKISKCISILTDFPSPHCNIFIQKLFYSDPFNDYLGKLILHSTVQEFTGRDYFSYDEKDFQGQSEITKYTLTFLNKLLSQFSSSCSENDSKVIVENELGQDNTFFVQEKLSEHLPNLLLLVAGNVNPSLWCSDSCQILTNETLNILQKLYKCEHISQIFDLTVQSKDHSFKAKSSKVCLSSILLHKFEILLTRERWEKNPFLCEAFIWYVIQSEPDQLNKCINQVMALALNFLHDHETGNKLKGLKVLDQLIEKVTNEELRWYNRAEVIYDALITHIYSKEAQVLDNVIPQVFSILKVIGNSKYYHFILSTLLTSAESEDYLNLRRIYISHLSNFSLHCNAICIGHLGHSIHVIENYLEIDDGQEESARLSSLNFLSNILKVAWPRVEFHTETILKILLKLVISIESSSSTKSKDSITRKGIEDKVVECLCLLNVINPNVRTCLEELKNSNHQGYLDHLLRRFPHELDICN